MKFIEKLILKIQKTNSLLCVGLDPNIKFIQTQNNISDAIFEHNKKIIDKTNDVCASYKPNIAFYECWGRDGLLALEKTISYIPKETPIILDAKRGDIGSTAQAYAKAAFEYLQVDCITVAPYMGKDSVEPFLQYKNAFVFVLMRTSNPSAHAIQKTKTTQGSFFYEHMAQECVLWCEQKEVKNKIGFVVAANEYEALSVLRKQHSDIWFLSPGIGVQGGDIAKAFTSVTANSVKENNSIDTMLLSSKMLPVVARGIALADDPHNAAVNYNDIIMKTLQSM